MNASKYLLVLNAGSSSLKFSLFSYQGRKIGELVGSGMISHTHNGCDFSYTFNQKEKKFHFSHAFSIKGAWKYLHDVLVKYNIVYVGFRVVHGGEELRQTAKIDADLLLKIAKYNNLAPLHNPPAIELIKLAKATWPRLKMAASFDTAWYKDLTPEIYLYAIPREYYSQHKIRKYGFHGLSHEQSVEYAASKLKKPLNKLEVISCHLGSGNSLSWFARGQVKDTSMGFSPNEGLVMSTRSGDLPPDLVLFLAAELKIPLAKLKKILNEESGLLGLAGTSDLREILLANGYKVEGFRSSLKFSHMQKASARLALQKYIGRIRHYLGAYAAQAEHLDAIVFTGMVGHHSPIIRKLVLQKLNLPRRCKILISPGDEDLNIANKTLKCLS
ncbi:MAG: hypothetical protein C3F02_00990 [Parcubacteria group bacterium]|nr:MAG: hypothetical protein C3F02_00990 [Parcubacteria group bacterium]